MTGSVSLISPAAVSGRAAAARSPSDADYPAHGANFGHALREQAADSSRQDDAGDDVSPSSTQRPGVRGAKAGKDRSPTAPDDTNSEPVALFSGPSMEPHVAPISIKIAAASDDAQDESDQTSTSTDAAQSDSKAGGANSFFWYAGDVAVKPAASAAVDASDAVDDSSATISSGMLPPPGAAGQIGGAATGTPGAAGAQGAAAALGNISALAGAAALATVGTSSGAGVSAGATVSGAAGASASASAALDLDTMGPDASGSGATGAGASGTAGAQSGQAASGASTAAARMALSALLAQSAASQFASGKGGGRTDTGSDSALTGAPLTSQAQPWSAALTMAAQAAQTTSSPGVATNSAHQPLVQSLADRLHLQITNGSDQAVIRLDPPLRGSVEITIRHDENGVQVHLRASDGEVARQLRDVGEALRQDLTQRHTGEVTVQVSHGSRDSDGNRRDQQKLPNVPGRALTDAEEGGEAAAFSLGQSGSELA